MLLLSVMAQKLLDEEERRLRHKKIESQTLGEILKGVALGTSKYHDMLARTRYHQNLQNTQHEAHRFVRRLVTRQGGGPHPVEGQELRRIKNIRNLYSIILEDTRNRLDVREENREEVEQIFSHLEALLQDEEEQAFLSKGVDGRYTLYDDSVLYGYSIRLKDADKTFDKVAIPLALAKSLDEKIITPDQIPDTLVAKYGGAPKGLIKKAEVNDVVALRVLSMEMDGTLEYLNSVANAAEGEHLDIVFSRDKLRRQNGRGKKRTISPREYMRAQVESGFKDFYRNRRNGYRAHHMIFRHKQFPSNVFEGQFLPVLVHMRNEGNPQTRHSTYDQQFRDSLDDLPEAAYNIYEDMKGKILEFATGSTYEGKGFD